MQSTKPELAMQAIAEMPVKQGLTGVLLTNQAPLAGLAPDYGAVPPAFLPFGDRSLLAIQIEALLARVGRLVVVLPEGFVPSEQDRMMLAQSTIKCTTVAIDASPAAVLTALRPVLRSSRGVIALMGDAVPMELSSGRPALLKVQNFVGFLEGGSPKLVPELGGSCFQRADAVLYHLAKASQVAPRCFNSLNVEGDWVRKRSSTSGRMLFEATWFCHVPTELRGYVPKIERARDNQSYRVELQSLPLLSELLLRGVFQTRGKEVVESCCEFLARCLTVKPPPWVDAEGLARTFYRRMILDKTLDRLAEGCAQLGLDKQVRWVLNGCLLPSLEEIASSLVAMVPASRADEICLLHGDFHFGNIFCDERGQGIRVIDPRGTLDGRVPCAFGDIRYDMAKLLHSVEGAYELLMVGAYQLRRNGPTDVDLEFTAPPGLGLEQLQRELKGRRTGRHSFGDADVRAITALLFLSMPPMHSDRPERQLAMLANGLRLAKPLLVSTDRSRRRSAKLSKF